MKKSIDPYIQPNCYADAERCLALNNAEVVSLIKQHGTCNPAQQTEYFRVLCGSIILQQLSAKAADTNF